MSRKAQREIKSICAFITGYERDVETGLDFAQARYFGSNHGRFSSPDPVIFSIARVHNPQIWNAYSYAGNNPLSFVDPDGLERIKLGESSAEVEKERERLKAEKERLVKEKNSTKDKTQRKELQGKIDGQNKLLRTNEIKLQGTRVVERVLAASNPNNLTLSDFELTTNPREDFKGVLSAEGMENAANAQAFVARAEDPTQVASMGNRIFIPTNSTNPLNFYFMATSGDLRNSRDALLIGGGVFVHENYHRKNPPGERPAYQEEEKFLMGVERRFLNKNNWQERIEVVRREINP